MKLQLIETQDEFGKVMYEVQRDGKYVLGTHTFDLKEAKQNFEMLMNPKITSSKVIMEVEINKLK